MLHKNMLFTRFWSVTPSHNVPMRLYLRAWSPFWHDMHFRRLTCNDFSVQKPSGWFSTLNTQFEAQQNARNTRKEARNRKGMDATVINVFYQSQRTHWQQKRIVCGTDASDHMRLARKRNASDRASFHSVEIFAAVWLSIHSTDNIADCWESSVELSLWDDMRDHLCLDDLYGWSMRDDLS